MKIILCCATMKPEVLSLTTAYPRYRYEPGLLDTFIRTAHCAETGVSWQVRVRRNTPDDNLKISGSYENLLQGDLLGSDDTIYGFVHDDVEMKEAHWDDKVRSCFKANTGPPVGVVGFGGATGHGHRDMYKMPYNPFSLTRIGYGSNVDDAEVHGERFTGTRPVAVLDGFALFCSSAFLRAINGFRYLLDHGVDFIGYDYTLCALAHRFGFRVMMTGVRCHHYGGGTSVGINVDRQKEWDDFHRWFYYEFKDIYPLYAGE